MLKAGSLLYSIYVCLLVSILIGGLLLLFSLNRTFTGRLQMQDVLIDQCESCLNLFLTSSDTKKGTRILDVFDDGISCEINASDWGLYQKLTVSAYFKKDTIRKRVLVGKSESEKLALYLTDLGEELKLSGTTRIKGTMQLPKGGFKTIAILGNNKLNRPLVEGKSSFSNQYLPQIELPTIQFQSREATVSLSSFKTGTLIYNDFDAPTLHIEVDKEELKRAFTFKGNIIITSKDTITLGPQLKFQDVIIQAPKVIVENDFNGSVQIFAQKAVSIGENSSFKYPSSVVVEGDGSFPRKSISIGRNSKIEGTLILNGSTSSNMTDDIVSIEEDAKVTGYVYCKGVLQLKGTVNGSVFTEKFVLKTKSGEYTNTLLDATIDSEVVPQLFSSMVIPTFSDTRLKYGVVKQM